MPIPLFVRSLGARIVDGDVEVRWNDGMALFVEVVIDHDTPA